GPSTAGSFSAFWMFAASTVVDDDQLMSAVRRLPRAIVNLPLVMFGLNVSRCTSLVGIWLLGEVVRTACASPVVATLNGATGTFCSDPPNTIENGPPSAPMTDTLPDRAGIRLSCVSTSPCVGVAPGVYCIGCVEMPLYVIVTVSAGDPPEPPKRRYCTAFPMPSVEVVMRALPEVLRPLATSCCVFTLANWPWNVIVTVVPLVAVASAFPVPRI